MENRHTNKKICIACTPWCSFESYAFAIFPFNNDSMLRRTRQEKWSDMPNVVCEEPHKNEKECQH
jgi:hypothetical protein